MALSSILKVHAPAVIHWDQIHCWLSGERNSRSSSPFSLARLRALTCARHWPLSLNLWLVIAFALQATVGRSLVSCTSSSNYTRQLMVPLGSY